jgi:hypothetical protein
VYLCPSHLDKDPYDGFAGGERLLDEVGSLRRGGTGGPWGLKIGFLRETGGLRPSLGGGHP